MLVVICSFMKSLLWATDPVVILSFPLLNVTPSAWRQGGRIFPVIIKGEWIPVNFSVLVSLFKHLLLSAHRPVLSSYLFFECSKQRCHSLLRHSSGYSVCKFLLTCTNTERLMVAKYLIIVKSKITFQFPLKVYKEHILYVLCRCELVFSALLITSCLFSLWLIWLLVS